MIFASRHSGVSVPDGSLTDYVLGAADDHADAVAALDISGTGRAWTYGDLAAGVRSVARGLQDHGLVKGDVLAILAPNLPEYPLVFHAAARAGGTVLLQNHLDTADDIARQLTDTGARWLVTTPGDLERLGPVLGGTGVKEVFTLGAAGGATPFAELFVDGEPADPGIDPARDVVALLHSSGSTGLPKAVMLTHRNLIAKARWTALRAGVEAGEKILAMPPFHHAFGLTMVMNSSLAQGATLVTMARFDPESYLRGIQEHRITRLYVVPTLAVLLAKSPLVEKYDLSSLRTIVSGGATLEPGIAQAVRDRIGCRIAQGYGMTEAMASFFQEWEPVAPGSVGHNAPNTEVKIIDVRSGEELGRNENGEILIRGPQVMLGYLNAAEATAKALDGEGFLHTGDLGHVDDDGELFIVDRIKELIKYKGQQVSPVELEAVLVTHPAVADAAVVGVPDEDAGESPKAFVVPARPVSAEDIIAYVAAQVAPYKKIRDVEFIDAIPRTPVGKIERRTLKERAASH